MIAQTKERTDWQPEKRPRGDAKLWLVPPPPPEEVSAKVMAEAQEIIKQRFADLLSHYTSHEAERRDYFKGHSFRVPSLNTTWRALTFDAPSFFGTLSPADELAEIGTVIDASHELTTWEDDWDGEGSKGYADTTWKRATEFLMNMAQSTLREHRVTTRAPAIGPGPRGSIDIFWERNEGGKQLLINVPEDSVAATTFFGQNSRGKEIKGTLDLDENNTWLFVWLMK